MTRLLVDKVVLVSGGSQALGAGIARAAVREGGVVVLTGRHREPGESLAAELAAGAHRRRTSRLMADPAQARGSVDEVVAAHGRIDCLVNSAGLTSRGTLLDTPRWRAWSRTTCWRNARRPPALRP